MKVKRASDVASELVSAEGASGVRIQWLVGPSDAPENFCMRLFELEPGGHTPLHGHAWEHEVYVLEGAGACVDENRKEHELRPGDAVFIPGNEWHCFVNNSSSTLEFLCLVPSDEVVEFRKKQTLPG